jgi:hypothetical protein
MLGTTNEEAETADEEAIEAMDGKLSDRIGEGLANMALIPSLK